jgi:hypothetical protein
MLNSCLFVVSLFVVCCSLVHHVAYCATQCQPVWHRSLAESIESLNPTPTLIVRSLHSTTSLASSIHLHSSMTTRVLLLIVVHNIFHFSFASVLQGAGNSPILITDYPDATCDGGIVTPSECPVLWNSVSAFDFRVLVANSQAFAQLWCRKAILASGFEDVQRLGQVTTVGLAENSTNRFVFRIPKAPPSFQSVSITTCTITIAVVPYTTYPGDSFVPAFDREFPVSTECNSFTYSRGCACAPPPAAPACAVNFLCDTLLGFPTEPNVCLEQHFTAKGYQAGNSVIIPPVTLQPCVRLTNCPLCNSRPICQWCGSQCINTDFQSCPISPNTTCGARPPPSTAPSSPTTAPPPPPSGQTPAPAVVTPVPIGPESPMKRAATI